MSIDIHLAKIILGNIGMVPSPNFGVGGLSLPKYKTNKTISVEIEDDNGNVKNNLYPTWGGIVSGINLFATDICDVNYNEFMLIINNGVNYDCVRLVYEKNYCEFHQYIDGKFTPMSLFNKLKIAAGFELIGSSGQEIVQLTNKDIIEQLYSVLVSFVENGS